MSSVLASLTDDERAEYWAALALRHCHGVGARTLCRLLNNYGSAHEALRAVTKGGANECGLSGDSLAYMRSGKWRVSAYSEWDEARRCEGTLILWSSNEYPPMLREIPDSPPFLYGRGDISLLQRPSVAVVGTRHVSENGRHSAVALAGGLAASGVTVVSGMAKGVDTEAHRSALSLPGGTVAVLGTGIGVVYPSSNRTLYEQICANGLVVSEFSPYAGPHAKNFPIRNRIISGLSLGTLVVEASLGSGSLITARLALSQNRTVYAVGGGVGEHGFFGCQELIKQGALPVFSYEDILNDLKAVLKSCWGSDAACKASEKVAVLQPLSSLGRSSSIRTMCTNIPNKQEKNSVCVKKNAEKEMPFACSNTGMNSIPDSILVLLAENERLTAEHICEMLDGSPSEISVALINLEIEGRILRQKNGMYRLV